MRGAAGFVGREAGNVDDAYGRRYGSGMTHSFAIRRVIGADYGRLK